MQDTTAEALISGRGRWRSEDTADILEELLREDRHAHLGGGLDGQGATGRLSTGA